jgi:glycosyltransferase involved in cell wall biosynthesis
VQPQAAVNNAAFSLIIPTRDRPQYLARAVVAVLSQTLPPRELIIVDQSESDESVQAVGAVYRDRVGVLPRLVYVHDAAIDGLTSARNEGLRRATCPWVVFVDDDGVPGADGLRLMACALTERPRLLGVGGIVTSYEAPRGGAAWFQRVFYRGEFRDERQPVYWAWRSHPTGALVATGKLNGGFMAFRKDALLAVSGFDERYRRSSVGEDIEVSQRLRRWAGGGDILALVGGAWLEHESVGDWKQQDRAIEVQIVAHHYLFRKNLVTFGNLMRYVWLVCGLGLFAIASSIKRRSARPLNSFLAGIRCVALAYRDCPFLKSRSELMW